MNFSGRDPAENMKMNINSAAEMLLARVDPSQAAADEAIPAWVLAKAKGIVFMWIYKAGFFASFSGGSGLVLAKFTDENGAERWSAPAAFQVGGGGGGLEFGAGMSSVIMVLDTEDAVAYFAGLAVGLSATLQAALGQHGRHAEGGLRLDLDRGTLLPSRYCYGHSAGVFAGLGMQGLLLVPRGRENRHFYGPAGAHMGDILAGRAGLLPPRSEVEHLHTILVKAAAGSSAWGVQASEEMHLFVSGRVCLFGEHSDWAGAFRAANPRVTPGATIVVGTEHEGLYANVKRRADRRLVLRAVLDHGEVMGPVEFPMEAAALLREARKGTFWSYACGVAHKVLTMFDVAGLEVDNYRTTLPVKKGLSSSAAVCVLVARSFSRAYGLGLSIRGEMELAYQGEILTPSQCGRMDQACAYGPRPVLLRYDGEAVEVEPLVVGAPLHLVVADLNAAKDTVVILEKLQAGFPHPRDDVEEGVHTLLGPINADVVKRALQHVAAGDAAQLGALMGEAQKEFDRYGGAACPEQLTAPVLHRVLATESLKPHIYGGKGVGSQGDGTVQFLCRGREGQEAVSKILLEDLKLPTVFRLTIPKSDLQHAGSRNELGERVAAEPALAPADAKDAK